MQRKNIASEPTLSYGKDILTPPTQTVSIGSILPIPVRVPKVEIRDVANNKLITSIEILSPVNKRNPNLKIYRDKIKDLYKNGINVLEIDLLRRGTRPFTFTIEKTAHYQMTLWRQETQLADIWLIDLKDKLPVLPIPLKSPDADVFLDLGKALTLTFERSLYDLSIDYKKRPTTAYFLMNLIGLGFNQYCQNHKFLRKILRGYIAANFQVPSLLVGSILTDFGSNVSRFCSILYNF
ncbi:MAG: DUF4058 family protein [Saprospiraceae bacterium]|nr:DUF4058 family protein [Saprospiraceae bacterium]